MTKYLLIQSNDPWDHGGVEGHHRLARDLAAAGNDVTVYLVQNGVLSARASATTSRAGEWSRLASAGVTLLADSFSLRERGIPAEGVASDIRPAELDAALDELAAGTKTLWL